MLSLHSWRRRGGTTQQSAPSTRCASFSDERRLTLQRACCQLHPAILGRRTIQTLCMDRRICLSERHQPQFLKCFAIWQKVPLKTARMCSLL